MARCGAQAVAVAVALRCAQGFASAPRSSTAVRASKEEPFDVSYARSYPRQYVAYATDALSPEEMDGDADKEAWREVAWSEGFVDIATPVAPAWDTRVKLRFDAEYLYVLAWLQEPQVWATLPDDAVIFQDNDFEVFVDMSGTTHGYKEWEVNALNHTWALALDKPYGDGGGENSTRVYGDEGWTMRPRLRSAVRVCPPEALNSLAVEARGWTVEVALPLTDLAYNNTDGPAPPKPRDGDIWRINFSRVEWSVAVAADGSFQKAPSCQSCAEPGAPAEDNWVWSPQNEVNMHLPERWGLLQLATGPVNETAPRYYESWSCRAAAMAIYYAEHRRFRDTGSFSTSLEELAPYEEPYFPVYTASPETAIRVFEDAQGTPRFAATVASPDPRFDLFATVRDDRFLTVAPTSASATGRKPRTTETDAEATQ